MAPAASLMKRRSLASLSAFSSSCRGSLRAFTSNTVHQISTDDLLIIDNCAREPQTSVSLQALMRTGRGEYLHKTFGSDAVDRHAATELVLMQVAGFLRRELPIRMAHRVADLQGIPILKDMKSVQSVKEAYMQSILEIHAFDDKIDTIKKEEEFAALIENIYERHASVLVQSKLLMSDVQHCILRAETVVVESRGYFGPNCWHTALRGNGHYCFE